MLAYTYAIPLYEEYLEKHPNDTLSIRKLGDCYRLTNDYRNAEKCYGILVNKNMANAMDKFYYGQSLLNNGKPKDARKWMMESKDERGNNYAKAIDNYKKFYADTDIYITRLMPFNTEYAEFAPAIYGKGIVFSTNKYELQRIGKQDTWTGQQFLHLVLGREGDNKYESFASNDETKFNNGPASFSNDGKTMVITVNNTDAKSDDAKRKLKLFFADFDAENKKWKELQPFKYNNDNYSCAHGSFSPNGNKFYFSSDMTGTLGGMDIFICQKTDTGWSKPMNAGHEINSMGTEVFPYMNTDGSLYYSSNGLMGMGGLDIYTSRLTSSGKWEEPRNMGAPINSPKDDFGLVFKDAKGGYLSSNRDKGKGNDDIYSFSFTFINFRGKVRDKATKLPLANTTIKVVDDNLDVITVTTDNEGNYFIAARRNAMYAINADHENYKPHAGKVFTDRDPLDYDIYMDRIPYFALKGVVTDAKTKLVLQGVKAVIQDLNNHNKIELDTLTNMEGAFLKLLIGKKVNDVLNISIELTKDGYLGRTLHYSAKLNTEGLIDLNDKLDLSLHKVEIGADLGTLIDLEPIFFDLGKYNIRPDAAKELDKIVKVLREYPTMVVELGSHSDCRGSAESNLILSDNRAKASAAYIVSRGIPAERIYGKGYGETRLKNKCECEGTKIVPCTDLEHQENRRTEFIIVKL